METTSRWQQVTVIERLIQTADSFRNKAFDCVNEWITESFIQPIHSKNGFLQ